MCRKQLQNISLTERHKKALDYAVNEIKESRISRFVDALYLYGSCAAGTAKWDSDVDFFLVLTPDVKTVDDYKNQIIRLKSAVMTDCIDDPEVDLKVVIGSEWKTNPMLYYENVRENGVDIWH